MRTIALHPRRGFTLIELMLAMALGMVIVFTAFAGVRVAGQCYTISSRLSQENALLRIGFMKALDELDFWTSYDDPYDSSMAFGTPNGGEVQRNPGLPFCPFKGNFPNNDGNTLAQNGDYSYQYINDNGTTVTGWHPEYPWPMSDPAVWCRVNMGESCVTKNDIRFGYYGQFSGVYSSFPGGNKSTYDNYPAATPNHRWLSIMTESLKNTLGYYGMCEYLPANTIYAYNTYSGANGYNFDGMSQEMSNPAGGGVGWFADGDGGTQFPRGLYRDNKDVAFGMFPINPAIMFQPFNQTAAFASTSAYQANLHQFWNTGQYTNPAAMQQFQNMVMSNTPLMSMAPLSWPSVTTSVERFLTYDRFAAVMRVKLYNGVTGQHFEFNFSGFGTSLRGARQQRSQSAGKGFVAYDNNVTPDSNASSQPNLDTQ
jgi:prepilin-type N-terminal cleavage/methylation domain-containing protein